ncbi:hypothetical protein AB0M48_28445 [Lentzea sp. NPDC051208]|uniref:hypothetical protein n=1 Tax=Lentzea sp. NPDC051208 TaxID=3154642 RepID=UPI003447464E
MRLLECGHAAAAGSLRTCEHMLVEESPDFYRVLTGSGVRYDVVCGECLGKPLLTVCEGCAERAEDRGESLGWRGTPEIRHEDRFVAGTVRAESWDVRPLNERCLAPLPHGWLALTESGLVDQDGLVCAVELEVDEAQPHHPRKPLLALHTSADGRYAAVCVDNGSRAVVLDLNTKTVVLEVGRGTYHSEQTPYPLAFLPGDRVVAATAWSVLDVFALPSGERLTEREAKGTGAFHGRLTPSPGGRWLLDDRWVWGPAGMPHAIDLEAWQADGGEPAGTWLAQRWYAWDQPVAWVSDDLVAVQRIGEDDEAMLDGVQLYALPSGLRQGVFAGPAGPMWGHGGLLYVTGADGLEVWDPERGTRIGLVPGFRPTAHRDGTFVSLGDGVLDSFSVD